MERKEISVDFTGFVLNKSESYYNHVVYNKGDEYIMIKYEDGECYCDIYHIHIDDNEITEDEQICTFEDYYDIVNLFGSIKEGEIQTYNF